MRRPIRTSRDLTAHPGVSSCCWMTTNSPETRRWLSEAPLDMYSVPYEARFASHASGEGPPATRAAKPFREKVGGDHWGYGGAGQVEAAGVDLAPP